jgi:hypothetical protein
MDNKRKYKSAGLTAIVSGAILLIMFLFGFTTKLPLPEEAGVQLDVDGGGGGGGGYEEFIPDVSESVANGENYVTDNSDNVNYNTSPNQTNNTNNSTSNQNTVDQRVTNFTWGQGGGNGTGNGTGTGSGNGTGNGTGDGNGNGSGVGNGNGPAFSLNGRSAKSLPLPKYTEDDQGKVVVTIYVDKNGKVTRAEPGAIGTTTSDPGLWAKAKTAALLATFSVDMNAPEVQRGTITYTFIKLN